MSAAAPRMRRAALGGFTLIEIMAVVAIFALLMGLLAPRVGSITGRDLDQAARKLGSRVDVARQRASLTGIPHRVLIDLEGGGYRVEWWVTEAQNLGVPEEAPPPLDLRGQGPIPMTPAQTGAAEYLPLPGLLGRFEWLGDSVVITGVDTEAGFTDRGEVAIEFDYDGTASDTSVHLEDENGRRIALDVLPLADGVRIHVEES